MLLLSILLGCGSADDLTCDSGLYICDTAAWWEREQGEQQLDPTNGTYLDALRLPGCDDGQQWEFSARISGDTDGSSLVNVWIAADADGGSFNEEHPLPVSTSDGDLHELQHQPDETALTCGVHDVQQVMTVAFRVYDAAGALADCGVLTTEAQADQAISDVLSGARDEPASITRRDELDPSSCATWVLPGGV